MLSIHAAGDWEPRRVRGALVPSTRLIVPEVERLIEQSWERAARDGAVLLFDGPVARFESWEASPDRLSLKFSQTSYKPFLGTNLAHPELADRYGRAVLANPAGVSPSLLTADGFLLLGRRNGSVAYYPNRTHPFAGAMEPRDSADVFAAVRRELAEEVGLGEADISELCCTGVAEDWNLRQYELIFRATATLTLADIESRLDRAEHHGTTSIAATQPAVSKLLRDPSLTPVAVASLLLWGATRWGGLWMDQSLRELGGVPPAPAATA